MKKIIGYSLLTLLIISCSASSNDSSDNLTPMVSKVLIYDASSKKINRINLNTGQLTPVSPQFDAFTNTYKCDELQFHYHSASGCYYALDYNLQPPNVIENQGRIVKYNKANQTISYIPLSNYTRSSFLSEILILPNNDTYILDYDFFPNQARLEKVDLTTGQISLYTTFSESELNEGINSMTYDSVRNSILYTDDTKYRFYYRNFNDGFNHVWPTNSNKFTNIVYANNYLYTYDIVQHKIFKAGQDNLWTAFSDEFVPFDVNNNTYSHKEMNLIYNPEQDELIGFHDRSNKMFRISLQTGAVTVLQLPYGNYSSPFIEVD